MSESVTYSQIHAYMLKKTQEYYKNPPAILVEAVMEGYRQKGLTISYEQARKQVTPIEIQRLIKLEMAQKWPDFMSSIPSNPLSGD